MKRLTRILGVMGLASVYLMQVPCSLAADGVDGGLNLLIEPDVASILRGLLAGINLGT